ncbi:MULTISPECIES: cortex morphogenetic protein CmpA [Bacillus cereus group]|uniref:Cortex morphogenetic protein CmpA n=1 Tax=Bacillus cereus TaxID=1396 RepID=A0A2B1KBB1_BACCE|nr:cortex morphogenetic protein CmpA [Bacillus cereus]PEA09347.1 cortex morphogenetic protein CmpA [Bacillus cereus]PEW03560.1 cortex morphogenetic protein CmpA [Bacillus cereus]PEX94305.1 cortex morphogenetic protein CmpA [Bacillus cereus]PFI25584.1 cortex morphogenetic protein CmpA [Bacillus cereus]PFN21143.1 cortex morphogenetic protein CmpA [Bacillus cereus]
MPMWLKKQMQRAYFEKNRYQIKLLNECWFYYSKIHQSS